MLLKLDRQLGTLFLRKHEGCIIFSPLAADSVLLVVSRQEPAGLRGLDLVVTETQRKDRQ